MFPFSVVRESLPLFYFFKSSYERFAQVSEWMVDFTTAGGVSNEGWQYATNFHRPYHPQQGLRDSVRRRQWSRSGYFIWLLRCLYFIFFSSCIACEEICLLTVNFNVIFYKHLPDGCRCLWFLCEFFLVYSQSCPLVCKGK